MYLLKKCSVSCFRYLRKIGSEWDHFSHKITTMYAMFSPQHERKRASFKAAFLFMNVPRSVIQNTKQNEGSLICLDNFSYNDGRRILNGIKRRINYL